MTTNLPADRSRRRRERLQQSIGILAVTTVVGIILGYRSGGDPPLSPLATAVLAALGVFLIAISSVSGDRGRR